MEFAPFDIRNSFNLRHAIIKKGVRNNTQTYIYIEKDNNARRSISS